MEHAVQTAVAVWTAECSSCPIDALSVIKIGNRFLVRSEFFQALQLWRTSPLYPLFADKRISSFRVIIGQTPIFTEVSVKDATIQKVCVASHSNLPDPLRHIAIAFGCAEQSNGARNSVLHLILDVTDGPTACGRSTNIIACEPDRELLELNGKDYSFSIEDDEVVIGAGPDRVNLFPVVLHEVGHWLGLGHVVTSESIMSEFLQESRCINDGDLAELAVALSGPNRYSPLTPKPSALLARRP
jgi:hypothetical protein